MSLLWLALVSAVAAPRFEDVSRRLPDKPRGPSFGVAWSDVDGDGRVDLFLGNHARPPRLLVNRGDGFEDATLALLPDASFYDAHGAVWTDLDGDGELDLFESCGAQRGQGSVANRAWIARDGVFRDEAERLGLTYGKSPARMPIPLDADGDGDVDVLLAARRRGDGEGPTALFVRGEGPAFDVPVELAVDDKMRRITVADTHGDARPEVMWWGHGRLHVRRWEGGAWVDAGLEVPELPVDYGDVLHGDLDGDGRLDALLLPRAVESGWSVHSPQEARFSHQGATERPVELSFRTPGAVRLELAPLPKWKRDAIALGAGCEIVDSPYKGVPPPGLCATAPLTTGLVGGRQVVRWSPKGWSDLELQAWGEAPLEDVRLTGLEDEPTPATKPGAFAPVLLRGTDAGWERVPGAMGLPEGLPCAEGTLLDVDADGDLDLFLVCGQPAQNLPDRLFLQVDGQLLEAHDHGAEGTDDGVGDMVTVADVEGDGLPDLLVTNGRLAAPWVDGGPVQLFSNRATGASVVRLQIVGPPGNRPSHGAVLTARVGDRVLRRDVGAVHWLGQDDPVLALGLGGADRVDEVRVRWPDGRERTWRRLKAGTGVQVLSWDGR